MKAKFFALLAVVLAVVSCQKDVDNLDVNVGGEQLVNITVGLPEATRAASGTGFDLTTLGTDFELRYILEIYVDGNTTDCIRKELFTTATQNVVFPVRLVPQRNYRVVAWADIVPAEDNRVVEGNFDYDYYYETSNGLDAVTIIENDEIKWNAMDEYRDAYTSYQVVNNFTANTAINLTLKRPFAKLRVVSTDIKDIEDLGYTLKNGVVEYNVDLKRQFNALYGTADAASAKAHTFTYPTPYDDKDNKTSRTLFADYIFVDDIEQQDAVQFTLNVYAQDGLLKSTTFNTDIALRANTLTTIIGEVLTEGGYVKIEINGELNEVNKYTAVSSASDLLKFINAGGEYILGNDIIVTADDVNEAQGIITRAAGEANEPKTTTINLNGKTITIINKSDKPLVTVPAGNTLTFTDNTNTGSIVLAEDSTESFIKNEGTVILEAGEINNHEDNNVPVIDGKIVVDGATVNDNKVEESNKLDNNAEWFADVIKNGGTVILSDDMSFEDIIVVTAKKPVVLDGNGKTLTSTADRAINVSGATDVTIKNLNIVASGERAINIIQNATNVTIDNVTATAAKYTVNVAGSAPNAVVAIKNSNLTGLNTVNVAAENADVTIDNTTITTIDNSPTEGYQSICLNKDAKNGKIVATNTTVIIEGSNTNGSYKATNGAEGGYVSLNGSTDEVNIDVAYISYGNNYYGFSTIADAIAKAKAGETVGLIRDVELTELLVIAEDDNVILDLNGKTLSHADEANSYVINNLGNLTITGNGTVNARGIYNGYVNGGENVASAKLTIENGTFNAKGTNGGAAVFNYGIADIKGGSFTSIGGYSLNNQVNASMTIADGVVANNGVYATNATVVINGGEISGNRSGYHVIYGWNANITINGGTFYNNNSANSTVMAAGTTVITYNDGTFGIKDGRVPGNGNTWTSCLLDSQNSATVVINNGKYNGGFRVQSGTSMTINGGSFNDCYGSKYNIYGTVAVKGGTYTDDTAKGFANTYIADGYKVIKTSENMYMVVAEDVNGYVNSVITNQEGVRYEGDWFETGMNDALWFNNYIFGGDAAIEVEDKTYGAIIMENCSGDFKNDVITINNDNNSVMILENLNLTIADGKKLIKSVNPIHQVFMVNITINGELMTQETIAKYLENVEWYQVVEEI